MQVRSVMTKIIPDSELYERDEVSQFPESTFEAESPRELDDKAQKQMQDFSELLNSLDKSLDKKKQLWKQIYENATMDRKNAYIVFADLYMHVHSNPAAHAVHGQTLSKYMERMSKGTDQLLKLAELVANAEDKVSASSSDEDMSNDDIYTTIRNSQKKH